MFPLGGKHFRTGEQRRRAVQAHGKGIGQEVNSRGGGAVGEEGKGHGTPIGNLRLRLHVSLLCAYPGPSSRHPQDSNDQNGLQRQAGPSHPRLGRKAMNPHMGQRHVDVCRENGHQQENQSPAGCQLDEAPGDEQADPAENLANATDQDAGPVKGKPIGHQGKKERGLAQMKDPRSEKECGQKETDEKDQAARYHAWQQRDGKMIQDRMQ